MVLTVPHSVSDDFFPGPEVNAAIKTTPIQTGRMGQWIKALWARPQALRPTWWESEYWFPEVVL